jgi:uncharacterized protein YodC (DUF2158 family)
MAGPWRTGDAVKLTSGGPPMTVEGPVGTVNPDSVYCIWRDGQGAHRERFHEGMLEAVGASLAMAVEHPALHERAPF